MTGTCCLVCGNSQSKDSDASFHRFPSDLGRRAIWLRVFDFQESDIKPHHRVCSRHFPNIATLGKRFASPIKKGPRAKRAKGRQTKKQLSELYSSVSPTPSSSRSVTPSTFVRWPKRAIPSFPYGRTSILPSALPRFHTSSANCTTCCACAKYTYNCLYGWCAMHNGFIYYSHSKSVHKRQAAPD